MGQTIRIAPMLWVVSLPKAGSWVNGDWEHPSCRTCHCIGSYRESSLVLGVASPFFPGILLSRKPQNTLGKWLVFLKNDG